MTAHATPEATPTTETSSVFRASMRAVGSTRIPDAVLMALFTVRIDPIGAGVAMSDLAGLALVAIASFRKPNRSLEGVRWYLVICIGICAYLSLVALLTGPTESDVSRLGRIGIMMLLGGFIASGRIDVISGLKGYATGLALNIPLFYAGVAPNNYGGLLTGFLVDKNVAGLTYAIMTVLLLLIVQRRWAKLLLLAVGSGAVVLTESRTSMAALAAALIWVVLARRLGPFFRICLAGLLYWGFIFAETNFAQAGEFADRAGSDALRERIDAASLEKTLAAPWYGHGLGEATAEVAGDTWFFHNAYWGLITEGGYLLLIAFLALIALAGFQFLAKGPSSDDSRIVEAASLAILLCASRLGEVFITQPMFILIGLGTTIASNRYSTWKAEERWKLVNAPATQLGLRNGA